MTDTDSKMMRRQQSKDTGVSIEPDETHAKPRRADSDGASKAAREAAKAGHLPADGHSRDEVLRKNQRADYSAEAEVFEDGRTDATPPLAKNDRSILGR